MMIKSVVCTRTIKLNTYIPRKQDTWYSMALLPFQLFLWMYGETCRKVEMHTFILLTSCIKK